MLVTSILSFSQNVFKSPLLWGRLISGSCGKGLYGLSNSLYSLKSQSQPTRKVFVYKIQVNPIHTTLKYGDYYDFMDR